MHLSAMEGFLRVNPELTNLPGSPTNSFLADEIASTCPLLTPSPPTNDLINPLPDNSQPMFNIRAELANKLQHVQDDKTAGDSASSSSSALADPVCGQLLNHRHHYQHITKDENNVAQETNGKVQPLQMTFKNPPDYFFMTWNWTLIRKISLWLFMAGLFAMVALVIAMVSALPKKCDPITQWYQGAVFYEIFPASFHDTNSDGIGDLKGISYYSNYIQRLGVRGVRLNSIFSAENYPEDYQKIITFKEIAKELGTFKDFKIMVDSLHLRNISLILDLPIGDRKIPYNAMREFNDTDDARGSIEFYRNIRSVVMDEADEITDILEFWLDQGVDGFYLKGLENHVGNRNFFLYLQKWKKLLGPDRVLIVPYNVVLSTPKPIENLVLNNVDLVDVHIDIEQGVEKIRTQLEGIQNGTLFSKASMPWIHWTLGDVSTVRLASRLPFGNATLGATLLQLMLPGTPSIFYGDEVGIKQVSDVHNDRYDLKHIHQLGAMVWRESNKYFTDRGHLPWMHGQPTDSNFDQLHLISNMVKLRINSPSVYVNSVFKDGSYKANAEVKYSQGDLLVIQRYYPRRKSFVVVSNLGQFKQTADLSKLLYSGDVVVGPRAESIPESVSFKAISLWPGESVVIRLD